MAATLCRLGARDAAVFVCLKHSRVLLSTAVQRQHQWLLQQQQHKEQQQHHQQHQRRHHHHHHYQQQKHRLLLQQSQQRWLATQQHPSPLPSSSSVASTAGPFPVYTTDINGFQLSSVGPPGNPHPRPMVVLIGWLNAKRKHLKKYQEVYWAQGFDVLTMPVSPVHIVRPKAGIKYTSRLLHALQDNKIVNQRSVVFHGFSIGAFIYTQLQKQLQQQLEMGHTRLTPGSGVLPLMDSASRSDIAASGRDGDDLGGTVLLNDRIVGLVLDSPAYIDHMCRGIANSVTTNSLGRAAINNMLQMYLAAFPKSVTFHYHESHRMFHHNQVPTLILYSPVDLISSAETSEKYMEEWKEKGFPVFAHKFPDSSHVSHFRNYQDQYLRVLHSFLGQLNLHQHLATTITSISSTTTSTSATTSIPASKTPGARVVDVEEVVGEVDVGDRAPGSVEQPLERVQAKLEQIHGLKEAAGRSSKGGSIQPQQNP